MIDFDKANFLIVGLARNCEAHIKNDVKKINKAFSNSNSVKWIIIESDSTDQTLKALQELKENIELDYFTLGILEDKYPLRTERIAACRNEYLRQIRCNAIYNKTDYVVVADLDGVNSKLTSKSVQSCWNLNVNWDVCFANQSAPYYDIWALRHDLWCPGDCTEQKAFFKKFNVGDFLNQYANILSKMIVIPKNTAPIRVKSAFGGLGIYKKNWLLKGEYVGINDNGDEVCEHVHFHLSHMKNANLYIVPGLINCGWNEHSRRLKAFIPVLLLSIFFDKLKLLFINKFKKKH